MFIGQELWYVLWLWVSDTKRLVSNVIAYLYDGENKLQFDSMMIIFSLY